MAGLKMVLAGGVTVCFIIILRSWSWFYHDYISTPSNNMWHRWLVTHWHWSPAEWSGQTLIDSQHPLVLEVKITLEVATHEWEHLLFFIEPVYTWNGSCRIRWIKEQSLVGHKLQFDQILWVVPIGTWYTQVLDEWNYITFQNRSMLASNCLYLNFLI